MEQFGVQKISYLSVPRCVSILGEWETACTIDRSSCSGYTILKENEEIDDE